MSSHRKITVWGPIVSSIALYVAALGMPALEFAAHESVTGATTLMLGWFGILSFDFPWLANPLYMAALVCTLRLKRRAAQICSGAAFIIGLLSLRVHQWYFDEGSGTSVEKLGPAFYCWMASFLVLFLLLFFGEKEDATVNDPMVSEHPQDGTSVPLAK